MQTFCKGWCVMKKIPLGHSDKFALIDDQDYEDVSRHRWYLQLGKSRLYARRQWRIGNRKRKYQALHNFLGFKFADHINGNGLDCRRENLREANHSTNGANRPAPSNNTSGNKGVSWHGIGKCWTASIHFQGKQQYLGLFKKKSDAAAAYKAAALRLFGEFAYGSVQTTA